MEQILEFASNNLMLVLALVAVVVAIAVNEFLIFRAGGSALTPETATRLYNRENAVFVDVRGENAFLNAHLPGAVNVPLERLEQQTNRLKRYKGRPVIVYCDTGRTSAKALGQLKEQGFDPVFQLRGGIATWQGEGLPVEGRS